MRHVFAVLCISLAYFRSAECTDSCITNRTDTGAAILLALEKYLQDSNSNLLESVLQADCDLVQNVTYKDYDVIDQEEFDFIITGAGSAGSCIAGRLSEVKCWKILLLESGGDPSITTEVPNLAALNTGSALDWQYRTQPQATNCLGSKDGRCSWPRGKCMGGCSSINFMWYIRGNARDYDNWESMGNPGWGYEDMLYYFKKAEGMKYQKILDEEDSSRYHSAEGPLSVDAFTITRPDLAGFFSEGMKELGVESYDDVNAQHTEGFFTLQGTIKNGRRCSSAKAYILPVQSRPNLKISKNSLVTKVLISECTKKAYGVTFTKNGKTFTVTAKKEVILTAGSIRTPQILMLSGIGPKDHLESLGIKVVKDLPVGENLHDHVACWGLPIKFKDNPPASSNATSDALDFILNGKGSLTGLGLGDYTGFFQAKDRKYPPENAQIPPNPYSDTQLLMVYFSQNSSSTGPSISGLGFNDDVVNEIVSLNQDSALIFNNLILLRPKSRGKVYLKDSNSSNYSLLLSNYLEDPQDVEAFLNSIKFLEYLFETEAFKKVGAELQHLKIPGCIQHSFRSEDYYKCILSYMTTSYYHQVGTCRMGPVDHPESVVDPDLRVIDVESLRVCDASIMPQAPSSNTNAATIAIAEKCADLIKSAWCY